MSRHSLPLLSLLLVALLVAACGGGGTTPAEPTKELVVRDVPPGPAVRVFQVDFLHPQGDYLNSSWGRLLIDPGQLAATTGMQRGYLNVAIGDRWVAVNIPVFDPSEPAYAYYFDLGLAQREKLTTLALYVKHSNQGLGGYAEHRGQDALHAVDRWEFNAEQYTPIADPDALPLVRSITDLLLAPDEITSVTQVVTNVQCAHNQCMTMAAANAMQYLEDMGQITLPHDHIPGQFGDATLVGQYDEYSGRGGTSRTSGDGLSVTSMVNATFEYLSVEGLSTVLDFRHQNDGLTWTILGAAGGDYTAHTITTWSDGGSLTHGWMFDRLAGGEGVVLVYQRDSGGGHAGRITGANVDDSGRRWFRFTHDAVQANADPTDSLGLENVLSEWSDLDGDGTPNIWSATREIRFIWSHQP